MFCGGCYPILYTEETVIPDEHLAPSAVVSPHLYKKEHYWAVLLKLLGCVPPDVFLACFRRLTVLFAMSYKEYLANLELHHPQDSGLVRKIYSSSPQAYAVLINEQVGDIAEVRVNHLDGIFSSNDLVKFSLQPIGSSVKATVSWSSFDQRFVLISTNCSEAEKSSDEYRALVARLYMKLFNVPGAPPTSLMYKVLLGEEAYNRYFVKH